MFVSRVQYKMSFFLLKLGDFYSLLVLSIQRHSIML